MSIIDIVIIAIVALAAIIGIWKGFFKTLISFFGWLVSIVIAIFLAKVVAEALLDVEFIKNVVLGPSNSLFTAFKGMLPSALQSLPIDATSEQIGEALGNPFLMILLSQPIKLLSSAIMTSSTATVADGLALLIANSIYVILVGIAIFIAIRILMMLFTLFANSMTKNKTISALNRFFGFLLGAVKGAAFVVVGFVIISYFITSSALSGFRNELDKSLIGKPVAEQVFKYTDLYLNGDDGMLKKLLDFAGFRPKGEEPPAEEITDTEKKIIENIKIIITINGVAVEDLKGTQFDEKLDALLDYNSAAIVKINSGLNKDDALLMALNDRLKAGAEGAENGDIFTAYGNLVDNLKVLKNLAADASQEERDAKTLLAQQSFDAIEALYNEDSSETKETMKGLFGELTYSAPAPIDPEVVPVSENKNISPRNYIYAIDFNNLDFNYAL